MSPFEMKLFSRGRLQESLILFGACSIPQWNAQVYVELIKFTRNGFGLQLISW